MFHLLLSEDVRIHNPEDINNREHITEESCYCMVVVLQQCGLFCLTFVFWNFNILRLLILMMNWRAITTEVCVVRTVFVFNKHCEDGTMVLKHSSWYVI